MTEAQKSWKLNLDFKSGFPILEKSVNRMYYTMDLLFEIINFYGSSDLLNSDLVSIEFYENDVYKKTHNINIGSIDYSNRFSF